MADCETRSSSWLLFSRVHRRGGAWERSCASERGRERERRARGRNWRGFDWKSAAEPLLWARKGGTVDTKTITPLGRRNELRSRGAHCRATYWALWAAREGPKKAMRMRWVFCFANLDASKSICAPRAWAWAWAALSAPIPGFARARTNNDSSTNQSGSTPQSSIVRLN